MFLTMGPLEKLLFGTSKVRFLDFDLDLMSGGPTIASEKARMALKAYLHRLRQGKKGQEVEQRKKMNMMKRRSVEREGDDMSLN